MASFRRQKEALRAATLAYLAGAHHVTQEVEKYQAGIPSGNVPSAIEARHEMLTLDYARLMSSNEAIDSFIEILNEEGLYPFGSDWPKEALVELIGRVMSPKLILDIDADVETHFRFRKGFKETLTAFARGLESSMRATSSLDHWLALLINTSFYAGANVAARQAENTKLYYLAIQEIESEVEPWGRYKQLVDLLEKQLSRETRRRTGLVSDLDY